MRLIILVLILGCSTSPAFADEQDAIALTVFDYINGWYYGDAARMERALHPDLAKRTFRTDTDGRIQLDHMGAMRLVQLARSGIGTKVPDNIRVKEVVILDVYDNIASVKAIMHGWIDYLHLARIDDRWVIVNVLWDMKHDE